MFARKLALKCAVPNCTDEFSSRFRFPIRNEQIKNIWIERTGTESLRQYTDTELYNKVFVCAAHFIKECKGKRKLLIGSLPTINMPGFHEESTIANAFIHNLTTAHQSTDMTACASASTSKQAIEICEAPCEIQSSTRGIKRIASTTEEFIPEADRKKFKGRTSILHSIRCTRIRHLSEEGQQLYKFATYYKSKFTRLQKKYSTAKDKLKGAVDILSSKTFQNIEKTNPVLYEFLALQFRAYNKKARGTRFTIKDKILALTLHKNSPRGYRLLQRIFSLPSPKTLRRLLAAVPFFPGINPIIFDTLKSSTLGLPEQERFCSVIFDEMSIQPSLNYNKVKDYIEGFQDLGNGRVCKFADHALVFLVQGIFRKWKQPVGFMFCESTTSSHQLALLIKEVISNLFQCNLLPLVTVCDQGASNSAAIRILIEETKREYNQKGTELTAPVFEVDGREIIPLFDYPHLLKCIRNNLLTKDLLYVHEGSKKRASWDHLVTLYMWDRPTRYLGTFTKLTDYHVIPEKVKKMKVSCCTQVFSRSVGKFMQCLIDSGSTVLPKEASDTSYILLFFDNLFDSFNGYKRSADEGHPLRCRISENSPHHEFWIMAKQLLTTMSFECKLTKKTSKPPTIKNWVQTIIGVEYLWKKMTLLKKQFLIPRNLNQDAVENFFCCIRSHGVRNTNPTCSNFASSFKTLVVNNFTSVKSVSSNCEDDLSAGVLNNLHNFLMKAKLPQEPNVEPIILNVECGIDEPPIYLEAYVAGYIAKRIFSDIGKCDTCMQNLVATDESRFHLLITARRFSHKSLLLPTSTFMNIFHVCATSIAKLLPQMCLNNKISGIISDKVLKTVNFKQIMCEHHPDICIKIVKTITTLMIFCWVKHINKILSGADERYTTSDHFDPIKFIARQKYIKRKK